MGSVVDWGVDLTVGVSVWGNFEGCGVGLLERVSVGGPVGHRVGGLTVGFGVARGSDGRPVGCGVVLPMGSWVWGSIGRRVGVFVGGAFVGWDVGFSVGNWVGGSVGDWEGWLLGASEGVDEGALVGQNLGIGSPIRL